MAVRCDTTTVILVTNLYTGRPQRLTVPIWVSQQFREGRIRIILRFAPLVCILATFPALGQVENAVDGNSVQVDALQALPVGDTFVRAPEPVQQSLRFPRLVASEPMVQPVAVAGLAVPPSAPPSTRKPAPVLPAATVGLAVLVPTTAPTPAVSPPRVAALAAVPLAAPPAPGAAGMSGLDFLQAWWELTLDYVTGPGRQVIVVAAMALAAALLFWRLGGRSRHPEEGVGETADIVAEPELEEWEPVAEAAAMPAEQLEEPHEELLLDPELVTERHYATLHDAVRAMKNSPMGLGSPPSNISA